jgi:hypothetical protein
MAVVPVTKKMTLKANALRHVLEHYTAGALTAAGDKATWMVPCKGRIAAVQIKSGAAGTGTGNTVIDVHKNGTSIWATAGNKPTLLAADSGFYTVGNIDAANGAHVEEGDIITYDVDSVPNSAGPTVTSVLISIVFAP